MPNRILRDGIITSELVDRLSLGAEVFYRRLMSVVDDAGRCESSPQILLAKCYPLKSEILLSDISNWLQECTQVDDYGDALITVYEVGKRKLLQINNFGQRERYTKFPGPPKAAESAPKVSLKSAVSEREAARASHSPYPSPYPSNGSLNGNSAKAKTICAAAIELWPKFLKSYPTPTQVDDGCRMWISLCDNGELTVEAFGDVMAGLERWKASKQWQEKKMRHGVRKWLHERRWKDWPEPVEKGEY